MSSTWTASEWKALVNEMRSASSYLEYGMGESTVQACKVQSIARIVSVESSLAWLRKVRAEAASARIQALYVDIGATKPWGYPTDDSRKRYWSQYVHAPWTRAAGGYDLILVDGRFRVACVLNALRRCPAAMVLCHDFSVRKWYRDTLSRVADATCLADSLYALTSRTSVDTALYSRLMRDALVDPR